MVATLCLAGGLSSAAGAEPDKPGHARTERGARADVMPSLAELPRPKRLWFVPDVVNISPAGSAVAQNGLFLARDERSNEIVALDTKTGEARWRARPAWEPFMLTVAGKHVLAFLLYEKTLASYALDTGALEWTNREVCSAPLRLGVLELRGGGNTAVGSCELLPSGPDPDQGVWPDITLDLLSLDLDTGKVLWRQPARSRMAAASSDGRVVATTSWLKRQVLVNTVSYRDARNGKEQWRTTVKDAVGALGIWRNVVLVVGLKLRALDARTGRTMWTTPHLFKYHPYEPCELNTLPWDVGHNGFTPDVLDGLLLWPRDGAVLGYVPASGKERRRWVLPLSSPVVSNEVRALQVMGKRIVVLTGPLARQSTIVIFDGKQRSILAVSNLGEVIGFATDVFVAGAAGGLSGFSLSETTGAERTLGPVERVQALLERMPMSTAGTHMHPDEAAELETVPDYAGVLLGIAKDRTSLHRARAAAVIGDLKIAAGIAILKAILDEKIPPEPDWPGPEEPKPDPRSPQEIAAYRKQFEAARRYHPPREYGQQLQAHVKAVELRKVALEALTRLQR